MTRPPRDRGEAAQMGFKSTVKRPKRRQPEREIQRQIKALMVAAGFEHWGLSQARMTMQGGGLPDDYYLHPRYGAVWVEAKRPGGKLRSKQERFRELHQQASRLHTPRCVVWDCVADCRHFLNAMRARYDSTA